jgi:hypothetical protein
MCVPSKLAARLEPVISKLRGRKFKNRDPITVDPDLRMVALDEGADDAEEMDSMAVDDDDVEKEIEKSQRGNRERGSREWSKVGAR